MALLKPSEKRSEPRRALNTRGLVVADWLEMVCIIVDVSDNGLRVRLDRAQPLPAVLTIVDILAGTACEAEVIWFKGMEAGLKCRVRPTSLHGLVPQRFAMARQAWIKAGGK